MAVTPARGRGRLDRCVPGTLGTPDPPADPVHLFRQRCPAWCDSRQEIFAPRLSRPGRRFRLHRRPVEERVKERRECRSRPIPPRGRQRPPQTRARVVGERAGVPVAVRPRCGGRRGHRLRGEVPAHGRPGRRGGGARGRQARARPVRRPGDGQRVPDHQRVHRHAELRRVLPHRGVQPRQVPRPPVRGERSRCSWSGRPRTATRCGSTGRGSTRRRWPNWPRRRSTASGPASGSTAS